MEVYGIELAFCNDIHFKRGERVLIVPKPELLDRSFFRKGEWRQGTCHLHICEFNSVEWREKIWFRNYLRLNPQIAKEYVALKKDLASRYTHDRPTYTMKKEPFIKSVIQLARQEWGGSE